MTPLTRHCSPARCMPKARPVEWHRHHNCCLAAVAIAGVVFEIYIVLRRNDLRQDLAASSIQDAKIRAYQVSIKENAACHASSRLSSAISTG